MSSAQRLGVYAHPPDPGTPVLLFLHGIGESYFNEDKNLLLGRESLFSQALPKHLGIVGPDHPLRTSFTVVAPQLPDRATPWAYVVDELKEILAVHSRRWTKLYIVGFSKGGLGAFQLAGQLHADALVTIDASPMAQPFKEAHAQWVKNPPPFWAIHTTYAGNEGLRRVQDFNEVLTGNMHEGLANAPKAGASWRTWLDAPAELQGTQRHTWIADRASESTAIYQWLLQH